MRRRVYLDEYTSLAGLRDGSCRSAPSMLVRAVGNREIRGGCLKGGSIGSSTWCGRCVPFHRAVSLSKKQTRRFHDRGNILDLEPLVKNVQSTEIFHGTILRSPSSDRDAPTMLRSQGASGCPSTRTMTKSKSRYGLGSGFHLTAMHHQRSTADLPLTQANGFDSIGILGGYQISTRARHRLWVTTTMHPPRSSYRYV